MACQRDILPGRFRRHVDKYVPFEDAAEPIWLSLSNLAITLPDQQTSGTQLRGELWVSIRIRR
jgi:hypothetical protein